MIVQLETETPEAFEALNYYIELLPSERTILRAYQDFCQENGLAKAKTAPADWNRWFKVHKWIERAKERDGYRQAEVQRFVTEEQISELIEYRKRQRTLASMVTETAMKLIEAATTRLETLDPNEISASTLPQYLKAAAMIAELASDAEAKILLLQDIVEAYQQNFTEKDEFADAFIEDDNSDSLEQMLR